jgi:hypothetical protein
MEAPEWLSKVPTKVNSLRAESPISDRIDAPSVFVGDPLFSVDERNWLEARVIVTTDNQQVRLLSPNLGLLAPPKSTRAWEPTLLWNHFTQCPTVKTCNRLLPRVESFCSALSAPNNCTMVAASISDSLYFRSLVSG